LEYFHASTDDVLHIHLSCLFITSNLVFFFGLVWLVIGGDWSWMFTLAIRIKYKSRWKQVGTEDKGEATEWSDGERARSELLVALICLYRD
jgi:hypothetical protein